MTPRGFVAWVFAVAIALIVCLGLVLLILDLYHSAFPRLATLASLENPLSQALLITAVAAIPATLVVFLLQSSRGELEFSAFGIKFKGPSGPVTLWAVVFLVVAGVILTALVTVEGKTQTKVEPVTQDKSRQEHERLKFLSLLFDRAECNKASNEDQCPHAASLQVRKEALILFIAHEKANKKSIDLDGIDLAGADLEGIDLRGISLRKSNFKKVNFTRANLSGADLSYAKLEGVIFDFAILDKVKMNNASVSGARFKASIGNSMGRGLASKIGVSMKNADLSYANFSNANLKYADMTGAYLVSANFTGANLSNATLKHAYYTDVGKYGMSNAWRMTPIWKDTICPNGKNSEDIGGYCDGKNGDTAIERLQPTVQTPRGV